MFELGQTVVYDIRIFSLRKSAFIYYVFFLQRDEDNTFSGYHGVGGRLRGMKPLSFLVDYLLQPNLGLVRIKDVLMAQ